MFKKHVIGLTIVWLALVGTSFWLLRTCSPDAQLAYQQLVYVGDQNQTGKINEKISPAQQTREKVSKQILYKKDSERLQSRLVSEHSDLILESKEKEMQVVERFQDLTCAIQEKLVHHAPENSQETQLFVEDNGQIKQYVRYLKAHEAVYCYKTGQLEAENVEVIHYLIPGAFWPASLENFHPILQGNAKKLQLTMFKERHLKAQDFQATFYDWEEEW